jgi:hypothetical protein
MLDPPPQPQRTRDSELKEQKTIPFFRLNIRPTTLFINWGAGSMVTAESGLPRLAWGDLVCAGARETLRTRWRSVLFQELSSFEHRQMRRDCKFAAKKAMKRPQWSFRSDGVAGCWQSPIPVRPAPISPIAITQKSLPAYRPSDSGVCHARDGWLILSRALSPA